MIIYDLISAFTDWIWGVPLLIILVGGGIILTVIIGGVQFRHLGIVWKSTIATLFDKELQAKKKAAGVSPFQALTAALGATVGTGNIVGVGAAIAIGGPGALFWMWVCGFVAMGIKYAEVTLSISYRIRDEKGDYRGGPFMYMRDGLGSKAVALIFGVAMIITLSFICSVHSSSISSNLASIGVSKYLSCAIMVAFMVAIILGGMKSLVAISEKLVPFMSAVYILCCLIIILANIGNIGTVFGEIFKGAFTGWSAVGGFTGATLATTIRWGLARGVYSNDAGLGLSSSVQAQAAAIDHPAQQGSWAIVETFIDTIIICSMTGFAILFTGVWTQEGEAATLASRAFGSLLGTTGQVLCVVALVLFGITSLITDLQGARLQTIAMFDSDKLGRIFQILVVIMVIVGSMTDISKTFVIADFGNAIVLLLNIPTMIFLGKKLRMVTDEWFNNKGDLSVIQAIPEEEKAVNRIKAQ